LAEGALDRAFYAADPRQLAPRLLNKVLVHDAPAGRVSGRIVEAEAYLLHGDPGSHAFRGQTPRTTTMFGPPGHLYVYFTYGMHWCCNVVSGEGAVLLRALAPIDGIPEMWLRREKARRERDLCSGPGRLTQALGLNKAHDGADLVAGSVRIFDDGCPPPADPGISVRIGLSPGKGDESPWRFYVRGEPNVSASPRR
jgi:DNA-3-methyladenine glycosylase